MLSDMYEAHFAHVVLTDVAQKWRLAVCERTKLLVGGEEKDFSLYLHVKRGLGDAGRRILDLVL